jgi:hypothetical protein
MDRPGEQKKITVCMYLSGERAAKAFTLLDALMSTPGISKQWDLIVGIDAISYDLRQYTHHEHLSTKKAVIIESKDSIGKDRFIFSMVANIRSEYLLLLDDSVTLAKGWMGKLLMFLQEYAPEEMAGVEVVGMDPASSCSGVEDYSLNASAVLIKTKYLRQIESQRKIIINKNNVVTFPGLLVESLGLGTNSTNTFDPHHLSYHYGLEPRDSPLDPTARSFTACMCTYGDHPQLILRCLDTILRERMLTKEMEIIVGCNRVSDYVMNEIEQRYGRDRITTLIRSPVNYNKSGMQRFTFRLARAQYLLALDDDMYFKPGWFELLKQFALKQHPFDAAGRMHYLSSRQGWSGKKKPYQEFVGRKKWWRNKIPHGDNVEFPAGQCFLARRSFVVENDYPDLEMQIDWDDVLLGDMVIQLEGRQCSFWDPLCEKIIIDDIPSRGQHGGG